jgi:hypothetical protein
MDLTEALLALATLPDWLRAALDPEQVLAVLVTALPRLNVRGVKIRRLLLDPGSGRWAGTYQVTTPAGTTALRGTLSPPGRAGPARPARDDVPFGGPGWHSHLAALGLDLEPQPAETALAVLPQLTDPERARTIVAEALGRPVDACAVDVLIYKPGSRAVLLRPHLPARHDRPGRRHRQDLPRHQGPQRPRGHGRHVANPADRPGRPGPGRAAGLGARA